jgi:DNA-binding NtrC family response regulator
MIARGRKVEIPEAEFARLKEYNWPGNVRELRNILERSLFLQKGAVLAPAMLIEKQACAAAAEQPPAPAGEIRTLAEAEREIIQCALTTLSGNLTQTSKTLGISLSTLKRKLKEYGLK